jgi:hypothetical protein
MVVELKGQEFLVRWIESAAITKAAPDLGCTGPDGPEDSDVTTVFGGLGDVKK